MTSDHHQLLAAARRAEPVRWEIALSFAAHALLLLGVLWLGQLLGASGPVIIAAGPGQGGTSGAMSVGIVSHAEWLKFESQLSPATTGDDLTLPPRPVDLAAKTERPPDEAELIPRSKPSRKRSSGETTRATDRPLVRDRERPYRANEAGGASPSHSALLGYPGSPLPGEIRRGVGLGSGGPDSRAGIIGGSEYGRRLQQALIGYYRLTARDLSHPRYVIVHVRIARNGRILSIQGGRLRPEAMIQQSSNPVINARVAAALLELDRHPIPFPPRLLPGASEAVAEVYFQY